MTTTDPFPDALLPPLACARCGMSYSAKANPSGYPPQVPLDHRCYRWTTNGHCGGEVLPRFTIDQRAAEAWLKGAL